jgi:hypothetical protein
MNHWFVYMIIASDHSSAYSPLHQHFPLSSKNCERHSWNTLYNPSTVSKLLLRETRKYIPQPACMKKTKSEWRTYAVMCESCHISSSMTKELWYRSPWMRMVCSIIPIMNGVCIHYVVTNDNSDSFNRKLLRTLLKKCLQMLKWNYFLGPVLMASSVHVGHTWTNMSR